MSDFAEYLHAAALLGLSTQWKRIPEDFVSRDEAVALFKDIFEIKSDLPDVEDALDRMAVQGAAVKVHDDLAGSFYRFDREQIVLAHDAMSAVPGSVAERMQLVGLKLFRAALERHGALSGESDGHADAASAPASAGNSTPADGPVEIDLGGAAAQELASAIDTLRAAMNASDAMIQSEETQNKRWEINEALDGFVAYIGSGEPVEWSTAEPMIGDPLAQAVLIDETDEFAQIVNETLAAAQRVFAA